MPTEIDSSQTGGTLLLTGACLSRHQSYIALCTLGDWLPGQDLPHRSQVVTCCAAEQFGVRAWERQARPILDAHSPAGSRKPCPGCGEGSGKPAGPAAGGGSLCAEEPHIPHRQEVPVLAAGLLRHTARAARAGQSPASLSFSPSLRGKICSQ